MRPDISLLGVLSGIEIALWDIVGKAVEKPVYALLGGRVRERLRSYTYLYPAPGEDERAGRWWWENDQKRECGLHVRQAETGAAASE